MLRRIAERVLVGVAVAGVLAAATFCTRAYAWNAVKSSNGLVISREADDTTASINVTIFHDYKGGSVWDPAYRIMVSTSYAAADTYVAFLGSSVECAEIPLVFDGGRFQMVQLTGGELFPVIYEPLNVVVQGTVPVSVPDPLPVSLDASVTIAPDPAAIERDQAKVAGVLVCAIAAGIVTAAGLARG
jgi:hypothetical protein